MKQVFKVGRELTKCSWYKSLEDKSTWKESYSKCLLVQILLEKKLKSLLQRWLEIFLRRKTKKGYQMSRTGPLYWQHPAEWHTWYQSSCKTNVGAAMLHHC